MNKRLKRTIAVYLVGFLLIGASSLAYLYFKSYLALLTILLLTFVISYLMPLWFRIFLKAKSYRGKYRKRLFEFSAQHKVQLKDIYVIPSKRSNACAFSFANLKSVCFNANTLENHPWDEIEGVMAHEIGHHVDRDIYVYTAIVAAILITSSWVITTIYSLFFINWYWLIIISLVIAALLLPIVLGISRWREGMADQYARKTLNEPVKLSKFLERMILYEEKVGEKINKNPTLLDKVFSTHPWVYERIKYLQK